MSVKVTYSSLREAREIAKERRHQAASFGRELKDCPYISADMRSAWIAGFTEFTDRIKEIRK